MEMVQIDTGERRLNDVSELMKEDDKVWGLDLDGSRDHSSDKWREGRIYSDGCSHVGSWGLTFVAVLIWLLLFFSVKQGKSHKPKEIRRSIGVLRRPQL